MDDAFERGLGKDPQKRGTASTYVTLPRVNR